MLDLYLFASFLQDGITGMKVLLLLIVVGVPLSILLKKYGK